MLQVTFSPEKALQNCPQYASLLKSTSPEQQRIANRLLKAAAAYSLSTQNPSSE
jgi:hypothetical protein